MTKNALVRTWLRACALGLVCLGSAPVAAASATTSNAETSDTVSARAEALSSLVVVEPVGAGFAFDVMNDAVSAVFLNGDGWDSASLLLSRRRNGPSKSLGGVIIMASGVYRIDLLSPVKVSPGVKRQADRFSSGVLPGGGSILFLAQFN
jgi:hypothetical protein